MKKTDVKRFIDDPATSKTASICLLRIRSYKLTANVKIGPINAIVFMI